MILQFKGEKLGDILDIHYDQPWANGRFQATELFEKYASFLSALLDEENFNEFLFNEELLDENNWLVVDEYGSFNIFPPAIYPDGSIYFRK